MVIDMKKIFVIFTYGIHQIGGTQMYTAGKAKYLKENGWGVQVFFNGSNKGNSKIPSLTEYIESGGGCYFMIKPPYKYPIQMQEQYLQYLVTKFIQRFNITDFKDCEIIVESHFDTAGYWAELFSAKVGARHFFICCNEVYRDEVPGRYYEDNLDFFYFKWKRNELITNENGCQALFNGYKNVNAPLYQMSYTAREADPIQDVDFPIDQIAKLDWNICHIGRISKSYVPYVIEGVAQFAKRHPDKKINFIFVGDITPRRDFIIKTFNDIDNVQLTALGDMVPIPRVLFSKTDVVCAISQSARFAANEGVLTIVGSAIENQVSATPGVLGYDTVEQVHGAGTFSYVEALERVLVKRLYDDKEYSLPKLRPAEEYYEKFGIIVENAAPTKEYYIERLSRERIREWTAIFPFASVARGTRVVFFGATEIYKDYRRQIKSQSDVIFIFGREYITQISPKPYCEIVATVDEHPENFDNSVTGIERLKQKDYDLIIITTYPQQAQAAMNKIMQIVPDMANRVIYNFQTLPT